MVDHVFEVRTNESALLGVMDRLLAPFACPEPGGASATYELRKVDAGADGRPYEILRNGGSAGRASSLALLLDRLVRETTEAAVSSSTTYAAIHAAAASCRGRAVVMPAPGGHGKTTTVAALVRGGWDFLTDEAALISMDDGLVHPFPRPLSISPSSIELLPGLKERLPATYEVFRQFDHRLAPVDLRPGCITGPVPLALVVFPSYSHKSTTTLVPMSRAEALVELLKGTFNLDVLGREAVHALATVVARVPCHRLSIGDLATAVQAIHGLLMEPRAVVREPVRRPLRNRS